jgi:hypothetical protein
MTFVQVVFPRLLSPTRARVVTYISIAAIYMFVFLMIMIPATTIPHYYGNTGLWCWIAGEDVESLRLRIGECCLLLWALGAYSVRQSTHRGWIWQTDPLGLKFGAPRSDSY